MNRPTRYTAVIPAYNEVATIGSLVEQVQQYLDQVIVVDDGSSDDTADQLHDKNVTLLRNKNNMGKGASLKRGFDATLAQGIDGVVTMDADGQHLAADIPRLVAAAEQHPNTIIIAARLRNRAAAPRLRRFANRFADFWISWAAGYPIKDSQSGFRVYPASLLSRLCVASGPKQGFVFESEIIIEAARLGIYSHAVPIDSVYRADSRRSHYRPAQDTWRIVLMVASKLLRRGMYPLGLLRALHLLPKTR